MCRGVFFTYVDDSMLLRDVLDKNDRARLKITSFFLIAYCKSRVFDMTKIRSGTSRHIYVLLGQVEWNIDTE